MCVCVCVCVCYMCVCVICVCTCVCVCVCSNKVPYTRQLKPKFHNIDRFNVMKDCNHCINRLSVSQISSGIADIVFVINSHAACNNMEIVVNSICYLAKFSCL